MSKLARTYRRAGKTVLALYDAAASIAEERTEKFGPSTCSAGCAHCCRLMVITTVAEIVPVVEYLTARTDWQERKSELIRRVTEYLRALKEVGIEDNPDGPARLTWWKRQIACPLLEAELCGVYPVRPGTCRYHVAVTSPSLCEYHPGAEPSIVGRIDLDPVEFAVALEAAHALGRVVGGSIASMFVLACRALDVDFPVDDGLVAAGVLTNHPVRGAS
jgi:Fe-S-cluster containining protein